MFTLIANAFTSVNQDSIINGGGDINCRIGNLLHKPSPNSKYRIDTVNV